MCNPAHYEPGCLLVPNPDWEKKITLTRVFGINLNGNCTSIFERYVFISDLSFVVLKSGYEPLNNMWQKSGGTTHRTKEASMYLVYMPFKKVAIYIEKAWIETRFFCAVHHAAPSSLYNLVPST